MRDPMLSYFTKTEKILWCTSAAAVTLAFLLFDRTQYLSYIASMIGITSLLFAAKANPVSQVLIIVFSGLYGYISYGFAYYGEMITYLGMTMPMAVLALVSWLRNPFQGNHSEVQIDAIGPQEIAFMTVLTAAVTVIFYFILAHFHTANLLPSTLSVTTSFLAVYLTFRRNPYYAAAYAANDLVLIVLWTMASFEDHTYVSVAVCFLAFLANDIYGFISWRRMERRQRAVLQNQQN